MIIIKVEMITVPDGTRTRHTGCGNHRDSCTVIVDGDRYGDMGENYSPLHMRLLGQRLRQLRDGVDISLTDAGARLSRSDQSVRRFEDGKNLIDELQLEALCELYGAGEEELSRLRNLRELARQPGWWTPLGPRPPATAGLLSMEE